MVDDLLQGDFSARVESMSDDAVKEEVLDVLRSMYPNATIPEPDAFYFPRWKSDPLYRGSYSNWPSSFLKAHHTNLRATVDGRLWFGGEATSLKYFGTSEIVRVAPSALYELPGVTKRVI
jgi:polyamine oxidase